LELHAETNVCVGVYWVGKPSDSLNATDIIREFFKAHPRADTTKIKQVTEND
jgi:hypothetical protein